MSAPIVRSFTFTIPGYRPLAATLNWSPDDPHAVQLHFDRTGPSWVLGRELLREGVRLEGPTGEGDVVLTPHPTDRTLLRLTLRSPDGQVVLTLHVADLDAFLVATLAVVDQDCDVPFDDLSLDLLLLTGC